MRTHIVTNRSPTKVLALALLVTLCGCITVHTVHEKCRHRVWGQYSAAVEQYGKDNVEVWILKLPKPVKRWDGLHTHHAQVKVRPLGPGTQWKWLPNRWVKEMLLDYPQFGCVPVKRIK